MYGAFSVNGVPARGVCRAKKLHFESHAYDCLIGWHSDHSRSGIPGCPAGCSTHYIYPGNAPVINVHSEFWRAKSLTIPSETGLPRKSTSGGRGKNPFDPAFLARGNHRYSFLETKQGKVVGQIGML